MLSKAPCHVSDTDKSATRTLRLAYKQLVGAAGIGHREQQAEGGEAIRSLDRVRGRADHVHARRNAAALGERLHVVCRAGRAEKDADRIQLQRDHVGERVGEAHPRDDARQHELARVAQVRVDRNVAGDQHFENATPHNLKVGALVPVGQQLLGRERGDARRHDVDGTHVRHSKELQ